MGVKEKPCISKHGCGEMLPLEDFHKEKGGKHGRTACCKKCKLALERKRNENPEVRAKKKAWRKANADKIRALNAAWYQANKEKVKADVKTWNEANPDRVKATHAAYHKKNAVKIRARVKAWKEANLEQHKANVKAWNEANADKVKADKQAYYKANADKVKAKVKAWAAANPDYIAPAHQAGLDMGNVVYVIRNYDGLDMGHDYVGCTCNFPLRMQQHKNGHATYGIPPKLNTENAEILHHCGDDREKALKIEASYHDKGYHGRQWVKDSEEVNNNYDKR